MRLKQANTVPFFSAVYQVPSISSYVCQSRTRHGHILKITLSLSLPLVSVDFNPHEHPWSLPLFLFLCLSLTLYLPVSLAQCVFFSFLVHNEEMQQRESRLRTFSSFQAEWKTNASNVCRWEFFRTKHFRRAKNCNESMFVLVFLSCFFLFHIQKWLFFLHLHQCCGMSQFNVIFLNKF